ncbi:MAG: ADP-ribosylglycohydrolase [Deltaproteobacteria bacterium]|nr:ADP-ribosylglycohydrolase [Deltaproteobacteria bacterium]MBM4294100.1 ADP-ribosylglycohydrolase [Deltaproteobacteria bacterium]
MDNASLFAWLLASHDIHIKPGPFFSIAPPPLSPDFDFGRIEGMLLGLAVGDALGNTSEAMLPQERRRYYGEIRDYLPNRYIQGQRVGLPSDDTQLAFWTLEQMLEDDGLVPDRMASRFARGHIFGLGATVRQFQFNYHSGLPWYRCGPRSAGNGALMRIAPVLIPRLRRPTSDLWIDAALAAMITHNDSGSIAACLSFVYLLWELIRMTNPPEPEWWYRTYIAVAKELELSRYRPRGGEYLGFHGPIWEFVKLAIEDAWNQNLSVLEVDRRCYSGAYLLETVPLVLYILMLYAHDPEEAIVRAVNDTKDNDTIAAIVGAAVGALHGHHRLPDRWLMGLLGRTAADDDGQVFSLIASARRRWWT